MSCCDHTKRRASQQTGSRHLGALLFSGATWRLVTATLTLPRQCADQTQRHALDPRGTRCRAGGAHGGRPTRDDMAAREQLDHLADLEEMPA